MSIEISKADGIATVLLSVAVTLMLRRTGYRLPLYVGGTTVATTVWRLR